MGQKTLVKHRILQGLSVLCQVSDRGLNGAVLECVIRWDKAICEKAE